jgi:hypothetical protein
MSKLPGPVVLSLSIQAVAGHKDLSTTMRYMHLSPKAIEDAIGLLEQTTQLSGNLLDEFGEIVETGSLKILTPYTPTG